jgi:hypothetical protein
MKGISRTRTWALGGTESGLVPLPCRMNTTQTHQNNAMPVNQWVRPHRRGHPIGFS